MTRVWGTTVLLLMVMSVAGCGKKQAPIARPMPPPFPGAISTPSSRPPAPPEPVAEPTIVPPEPVRDDAIASASLDDLNRNSPLKPVFFDYNSSDLSPDAQRALDENAATIKKYPSWAVTIEGHCDERGTAEYNLALGERRSVAARAYLVSLGIPADRVRTVSYGKEFPFDPGHDEAAFRKNRRAHFVITAK
ncbi:MAG: peptidoglycan-associated lipoprotein [Acidobacteria bacterium 13_1_40CM_2_64_6]|nr:MAG: peptidoglycan-associated lipoprotein [Acidobacteria bacterium 13_1_40CM_65_14]OLD17549.1 MAG: peptidoglycan-associated lipoprotein [Acidobacteria bacterium 13_1_40CM_3_65_5]OLD56194.1 MAG: peptidoglycan-associated lipoprotein [Acidobacteria bacterium 13_1_40CM_2_64_6]